MSELHLPKIEKRKRDPRPKINWTEQMISYLRARFPLDFNKDIAKHLGVSWRSLIRKARELGLEKEADFLEKRRPIITEMAVSAHPPHPYTGVKGWSVPNGEAYRFKPGNISCMTDPVIIQKVRFKRNETIKSERLRLKYGLPAKTKLKLNPWNEPKSKIKDNV